MRYADLKRKLYAGNRPGTIARVLNRAWAWLHSAGIAPNYLVTLEVAGRKTGRTVSFPLVLVRYGEERFLVSMLGERVAWVRNVRAAGGRALMRHGRREHVRLVDVPVQERAAIIKAYVAIAPGARPHIDVQPSAPLDAFERVAPRVPVFRIAVADTATHGHA